MITIEIADREADNQGLYLCRLITLPCSNIDAVIDELLREGEYLCRDKAHSKVFIGGIRCKEDLDYMKLNKLLADV